MRNILIIGLGGFLGAIFRYLLSGSLQYISKSITLPWGTLGVNIVGCFAIGLLGGWSDSREFFSSSVRLFIFVGFLGSFTTFSTFGYETCTLIRDGQIGYAIFNIALHLLPGLAAVWLGYMLSNIRG